MSRTKWTKRLTALIMSAVMLCPMPAAYAAKDEGTAQEKLRQASGRTADLTISTARELTEFAHMVNSGNSYEGQLVELAADIEFDGTVNNFTPIGDSSDDYFAGTFDGCGHTISGIRIVNGDYMLSYYALFGYVVHSGVVKNVTVKDCEFESYGKRNVGGIVGMNWGIVDNCHNRNTSVSTTGAGEIGGIVGFSWGKVMNCSSTGPVISQSADDACMVGGIVGYSMSGIYNSCNAGVVEGGSKDFVGGIVGHMGGGALYDSQEIVNCYNAGRVSDGSENRVGGIAGYIQTRTVVADSYCSEESSQYRYGRTGDYLTESGCGTLPAAEMCTTEFLDKLNDNRGDRSDWIEWEFRPEESAYPLPTSRIYLSWCDIRLSSASFVYDGDEKVPEITVTYGGRTLTDGTDYTAVCRDNTNAGRASVELVGEGGYIGNTTQYFTIKKANQSISCTKAYDKAYGNRAFTVNAKRTAGNGALTYASSNKNVAAVNSAGKVTIKGTGAATITVRAAATANYNAKSVKITVKVSPKKQKIKSLKTPKGWKLTASWTKDTRATGYQIQYSTDKSFKKSVKTATVTKNKTTSKTITNLTAGKKYYVRVRSYKTAKVNGKSTKLYGAWSAAKRSGSVKNGS